MRKSIFLLFLLLIACAPAPTAISTSTAVPATPTITPNPTETPRPTATPSGFQVTEDGQVQVYEDGKWVDMVLPDTIWGEKPEGASIVLDNDIPTLRIELNDFQTANGSEQVDIAVYNKETKIWKVKLFSVTRISLGGEELYDGNYSFYKFSAEGVNFFSTRVTILGFNIFEDLQGKKKLNVMVLYKGKVSIVSPYEFAGSISYPNGTYENKNFAYDEVNLQEAIDVVRMANENFRNDNGYGSSILYYLVPNNGATAESCRVDPTNWPSTKRFTEWCMTEIGKGKGRRIPTRSNLDGLLFNGIDFPNAGKDFDPNRLMGFWDIEELQIEGAFLQLGYNQDIDK